MRPEPDDAELSLPHLRSDHEVEREPLPLAATDDTIAFDDAPRDRQDERDRHVRGRFGQHVGRVREDDALRARVRHIEIVVADGHVRDDLQIAAGVDDVLVDLVERGDDERVLALDALDQLVFRQDAVAIDLDIADGRERLDGRRRQLVGDENRRLRHG